MSLEFEDSKEHKYFESGALRDRPVGKGIYVGISPYAMKRLADRIEVGKLKYGDYRNWEKGMFLSEYCDSALRHLFQYIEGDNSEDHAAACLWNIMALIHTEETHPEMMDLPLRKKRLAEFFRQEFDENGNRRSR